MAPIKFKPTGTLNIMSDPAVLGDGDMTRCLNLRIDRQGLATLRRGSSRFATQIATPIHKIVEQDGYRYAFASTSIYQDESSIATGLTSAAWSAVKYKAYLDDTNQIYATNGTDKKRIEGSNVYEWGIAAPDTASTVSSSGTGAQYDVYYTYAWKDGTTLIAESNPSPVGYAADCTEGSVIAVSFTPPTDTQVTHIRFYVSFAGGGTGYFISELEYDSTTYDYAVTQSWEENEVTGTSIQFTSTSTLTSKTFIYAWEAYVEDYENGGESAVLFAADDLNSHTTQIWEQQYFYQIDTSAVRGVEMPSDNDRLPDSVTCLGGPVGGYLFAGVANKVYFCAAQQPDYWPVTYYIELGSPQFPVKSIVIWNGVPYAITTNDIWQIQGSSADSFYPIPLRAKTGCLAQDCAAPVAGLGIVRVAHDGIYAWDGANDTRISDETLGTIFSGETVGVTPYAALTYIANSWLLHYKDYLYFAYPATDYPDNIIAMHSDGKVSQYQYGASGATKIVTVGIDYANERIIAGDSNGYLWVLEDSTVTADNSVDISWDMETKVYGDQVRRYMPRWARYDVDLGTGGSATAQVKLDGVSKQSHTIADRNTRKRLITPCNGNRLSLRLSGTGPVTVYQMEVE